MKIKIILLSLLLLCGCSTIQNKEVKPYRGVKQHYVKKEFIPLGCFYCFSIPNKVSKQEYRILQLPIQNCYKKQ